MGPNLFGYVFYFFGGMNSKKTCHPCVWFLGWSHFICWMGKIPPILLKFKKYVSIVKCYYSSIAPMHSSLGLQFMWGPCGSKWFGPPKRRGISVKNSCSSAVFQTDGKNSTPAFLWMKCGAYQTDETVLRTINWLISVESKYIQGSLSYPAKQCTITRFAVFDPHKMADLMTPAVPNHKLILNRRVEEIMPLTKQRTDLLEHRFRGGTKKPHKRKPKIPGFIMDPPFVWLLTSEDEKSRKPLVDG